jgi:hypothetical protein
VQNQLTASKYRKGYCDFGVTQWEQAVNNSLYSKQVGRWTEGQKVKNTLRLYCVTTPLLLKQPYQLNLVMYLPCILQLL